MIKKKESDTSFSRRPPPHFIHLLLSPDSGAVPELSVEHAGARGHAGGVDPVRPGQVDGPLQVEDGDVVEEAPGLVARVGRVADHGELLVAGALRRVEPARVVLVHADLQQAVRAKFNWSHPTFFLLFFKC